jgi:hypothetical protein
MKAKLVRKLCLIFTLTALMLGWPGFVWADELVINKMTIEEFKPEAGLKVSGVMMKVTWFTNKEADGRVDYGPNSGYGSNIGSSVIGLYHEVILTGLKGETVYHFKIISKATTGQLMQSFDQTFKTPKFTGVGDPPVISDVRVSYVRGTYFLVTWYTDEPADAVVEYATEPTFARVGWSGGSRNVTSHEVLVSSLRLNTTYYFRVRSADNDGNKGERGGFIITTASSNSAEKEPLAISQISPVSWPDQLITDTTITFRWHTNHPTRGRVEIARQRVGETGFLETEHELTVKNLKPNTTYVAKIYADTVWRLSAQTGDITLMTPATYVPPAPLPDYYGKVAGESICVDYNAYNVTCRNLPAERKAATEIKNALYKKYRGRTPSGAARNWFTLVRACAYGGYPIEAIVQAVRFGGKTVHPSIPWSSWKNTKNYKDYINRR